MNSDGAIFNNAAQVYNHRFYFNTFSPKAKLIPEGKILTQINKKWGSLDNFKSEFNNAATKLFGSGWVWLASDANGDLYIISTPNAQTPLEHGLPPFMVMDVLVHASYLDFKNKRDDYINGLWNIIDWNIIANRYMFEHNSIIKVVAD